MDFIDDKDFVIVRKNLNILSVIILLLAFTNATISVANLFGLMVEMNGAKLYVALYLAYVYFFWRYLTKLPLTSGFWADFTKYYMDSWGGVNTKRSFAKYREQFVSDPSSILNAIKSDNNAKLNRVYAKRFGGNSIREVRIVATFVVTKPPPMHPGNMVEIFHDIEVSRIALGLTLVKFCVRYDKFGDYLFPIVLVLANVLFFLFKSSWQGSLKNVLLT